MTTKNSIQFETYFQQVDEFKRTSSSPCTSLLCSSVREMSLIVLFSILVLSVHNSHCGLPSLGACPSLRGVSDFSVSRYMGRWYEYSNTFEIFQIGGTCVRATYTDNGDGTVGVFNEQILAL